MKVARIKSTTGYSDGTGKWNAPKESAQQFFPREAEQVKAFMQKQGTPVEVEVFEVDD